MLQRRVNRRTGVAVMVHTDPHARMALEALGVLESAGADLGRVSICHVDSAFLEEAYLDAVLATGASVELDTFGENFCLHPNYGPSDLDRIRLIGTNEEQARKLLEGTELVPAATMDEGVKKAIAIANG